ncbi:hypothetical protein [Rhodococcus sp. IEGM 1305]|uniref:hypothetical protein n=1 Tax=Rhodococcus sp. IEGM 1305 TaxID=3047092 RepID=UPI0024B817E8|nr:hypothetical protein [Rhodococcus sp. IEGM 1305]MDI9947781.1 hypothetical protein [Rhodococcus sp. IEGM 1305]
MEFRDEVRRVPDAGLGGRLRAGAVDPRHERGDTSYPEIGGRGRIVLDGGVVVLDHGKPSFGLLQRRMGIAHATKPFQRRIPVTFLPFDVLAFDDLHIMSASYLDRRAELAELESIIQNVGGLPITVPPHWENQSSRIMLNAANSAGMEGNFGQTVDIDLPSGPAEPSLDQARNPDSQFGLAIGFVGCSRSVAVLILGAYDATGNAGYSNLRSADR